MTNEEILDKELGGYSLFDKTLLAMDAAREDEAVGILEFVDKGNWWSEDGLWSNEPEWQNLTSEQLYQLYLKHKNEKKWHS